MYGVVDQRGEPFGEPEAFKIFSQIVDGLEVAHSLGLAHHDMSFENLITDDAEGYSPFIIDWGAVVKVALTDRGIPVRFLEMIGDWLNCEAVTATTSGGEDSTIPQHFCFMDVSDFPSLFCFDVVVASPPLTGESRCRAIVALQLRENAVQAP